MASIRRTGVDAACPGCGRANFLLLPEACCGNEFVWHVRCGACGGWRWFHAREDAEFARAIQETARRRGEASGLSAEGTREAHAAYEGTLPPCPCGGLFHVTFDVAREPCLACGRPAGAAFVGRGSRRSVDIPSLR